MISFDYSIDVTTEVKTANHFCWKIGFIDMIQQAQVPVAEIVDGLLNHALLSALFTGGFPGDFPGDFHGHPRINLICGYATLVRIL